MITTADALVRAACAAPRDDTPRLVLADRLAELGEAELEAAVRDPAAGPGHLAAAWRLADRLDRAPDLRCLWAVVVVGRRPAVEGPPPDLAAARSADRPSIEDFIARVHRRWGDERDRASGVARWGGPLMKAAGGG